MLCRIHFFDVWLSSSCQLHFEFRAWFLPENGIMSIKAFVVKPNFKKTYMNRMGTFDTGSESWKSLFFNGKFFDLLRTHAKEFRVVTSRHKITKKWKIHTVWWVRKCLGWVLSDRKLFHWKIWTLSFQKPCRMSPYDS